MQSQRYQIKIYDLSDNFVRTINNDTLLTDITFTKNINGGMGEVVFEVNGKIDIGIFDEQFKVKIFETDPISNQTFLIYGGLINNVENHFKGFFFHRIYCYGYIALSTKLVLEDALGNYVYNYTGTASAMMQEIIDDLNSQYGYIYSYDGTSIETDTTSVTIKCDKTTAFEAMNIIRQSVKDFYFYIDAAGKVFFKKKSLVVEKILAKGRDIYECFQANDLDSIVNHVIIENFLGTDEFEDATSIATRGRRTATLIEKETDTLTAQKIAEETVERFKNPVKKTRAIIASQYVSGYSKKWSQLEPGMTVSIRNVDDENITQNIQIVKMSYFKDQIELEFEETYNNLSKSIAAIAYNVKKKIAKNPQTGGEEGNLINISFKSADITSNVVINNDDGETLKLRQSQASTGSIRNYLTFNIKYRELNNVDYSTQIGTITRNINMVVNAVDWAGGNMNYDFGMILKGSVNYFGTTFFLVDGTFRIYNFDVLGSENTENGYNKSAWLCKDNFLYKFRVPSTSNNQKMYYERYIIGTEANYLGIFKLQKDTGYGVQISVANYNFGSTGSSNLNGVFKIIKHNAYHIFINFGNGVSANKGMSTNTITFDIDNNITISQHNLITIPDSQFSTCSSNVLNFDTYFTCNFGGSGSVLRMFQLSGSNIINVGALAHSQQSRDTTANRNGQYNKLDQNGRYLAKIYSNIGYYNGGSTTIVNSGLLRNSNTLNNTNFGIQTTNIFKGMLQFDNCDMDNLQRSTVIFNQSKNIWVSRMQGNNNRFIILLTTGVFFQFELVDDATALGLGAVPTSGFVNTKTYTLPTGYSRLAVFTLQQLNSQTTNYEVSFDNGFTWIVANLNTFINIPTPYPASIRFRISIITINRAQSPQIFETFALLYN